MAAYNWTCSACGHANAAGGDKCTTCLCPALARHGQIAQARDKYKQAGGVVLPGAALEPDVISPVRMLLWFAWLPLGLLTGVVPKPNWTRRAP